MLLFNNDFCIKICAKNTNKYVIKAIADLQADFEKISKHSPEIVNKECENCIIIEENTCDEFDAIKDESFKIKIDGKKIIISAPTYLGTMWGIYTFSEKVLGINPCYHFNDMEIKKHESLEISDINIESKPDGFTFRGVFINDEDMLTGWKIGTGKRPNIKLWETTLDDSVIEMAVETVLRLKMNLVIPATFVNLDNPDEKRLADFVAARGIYISQHHVEPLGVSGYTFSDYCSKYNKTGEFSYLKNPDIMEEVWEFYAKKWAEYDNVVWQIGLRGLDDRPAWYGETENPTDDDLRKYGDIISGVYSKQIEIAKRATNGKARHFTSTLWMEGSELMEKGFLSFPEDVTVVFADAGLNQMYGNEYFSIKRDEKHKYGIYYHLNFFDMGPHLAPQTGIAKLYYNTKLAYDNGDNSYYILNVSNIREFVFELKACAEMLWNTGNFSTDKYYDEYSKAFENNEAEVKRLVLNYFNFLPSLDAKLLTLHHYYGVIFNCYIGETPENVRNYIIKEGDVLRHGSYLISELKSGEFTDRRLYKLYYDEIKIAISNYEKLCAELEKLCEKLPAYQSLHIKVKWLLFSKTLLLIYKWYANLYEARENKSKESLKLAIDALEEYLKMRKCAEYGEFENWYRGEFKFNVKNKLCDTKALL